MANLGPLERLFVIVVAIVAVLTWGAIRHPSSEYLARWAQAHRLPAEYAERPIVVGYLRRSRAFRTVGGAVGAIAGYLLGNALVLALLLAGFLVGALAAELSFVRPVRRRRVASVAPRTLRDYLPSWALRAQRGLAAAVVLGAALVVAFTSEPAAGPLLYLAVAVVLTAGVEAAERLVVHRPQPAESEEQLAIDDALRSASLHAATGSLIALLLLLLAVPLGVLAFATAGVARWVLLTSMVLCPFLALASWWHLAHPRAWRVERTAPAESGS